jgi:hypothetical protein
MAVSVSSTGLSTGGAIDFEGVVKEGPGQYLITFDRSVLNCVWSVTLGRESSISLANPLPEPGQASATASTGGTLRVYTANTNGTPTDKPFHATVVCRQS